MSEAPEWLDDKGKIIEHRYCQCFLEKQPMLSKGENFFTTEGIVTDKDRLLRDVFDDIKEHLTGGLVTKAKNLLEAIRMECYDRGELEKYQDRMYVRFMAFSNGDLEALYDKSEGFFRRQLILQTKRKPPGRVDDPFLSDKLKQEAEGIFLWCLDGLRRLQSNNYRFTVSQRAAENKEHAKRNANNLVEFLQSEGYIQLKADSTITSRDLYAIYQMWCEDNGYRPIAQRSVSSYLKSHLEDYNLEASNKITNKSGKQVNGFWGIQALTTPIIL